MFKCELSHKMGTVQGNYAPKRNRLLIHMLTGCEAVIRRCGISLKLLIGLRKIDPTAKKFLTVGLRIQGRLSKKAELGMISLPRFYALSQGLFFNTEYCILISFRSLTWP